MHRILLAAVTLFWLPLALADTSADEITTLKEKLSQVFKDPKQQDQPDQAKLDTLKPSTTIPGWYEMEDGMQLLYISADGKYLLHGDLIDLATRKNLTDAWREKKAVGVLAGVKEKDMVVIGPKKPKRTITVFTDIDCGYCQQLQKDVPELNKHGVKVRYMAFPRAGLDSESYKKAVAVWCAADRGKAIGVAKAGGPIEMKTCNNPVKAQYELGQQIGIRGTPTIFLDDGRQLGGYLPVPSMLAILDLAPKPPSADAR
jgi:thiol:disulfide interchange protein DsbC